MVEFGVEFAAGDGMFPAVTTTLLLATRNRHKAAEICGILGEGFEYLTLHHWPDAPAVAEDADTFAGNAAKKAVELARWLGKMRTAECGVRNEELFVLADDSGLEVDALNGAPGVHSARFAVLDRSAESLSANSSDAENNAKLLRLLKDVPAEKRTARFRCVIAVASVGTPHSTLRAPQLFEGVCEGRIGFALRGSNGFGYDPLFVATGLEQTFAELGAEVKNRLSHRARALQKFREYLTTAR